MDDALAEQALRLALSAELTRRAARLAAEAGHGSLTVLAGALAAIAGPVARAHRLTFDPPYPGVTGGVEDTAGGRRLVLACTARRAGDDLAPAAVVFTTLIAGRPPQVTAAPPGAPIPAHWRAPART